ncbi:MAG: Endoribonuclease YbeY [Bacteroidetes bacterium ADurb.Bin408]|nr:MAG: Endoribonuclease YbeY [Bacteroidetes bacterium ADurb.Bin408]
MAIRFFTEDIDFKLNNEQVLKKWLSSVAVNAGKKTGAINYIFCSDAFLLNLNIKYLNHNTFTDIITFPDSMPGATEISGDIYISIDRINENAILFKTTTDNELHRVMVHGLLHLLGHTDKTKAEKEQMSQAEDRCLAMLKV